MTHPLFIFPEAENETLDAMHWYEARRPGLGIEFLGVVEHFLVRICESPEQFAVWPRDRRYRRAVLHRFPYVVVFELRPEGVEVVAVAHAKQRADYWKDRSRP